MILGWIEEAQQNGARLEPACRELGLDPRTVQRWRGRPQRSDLRRGPSGAPANKLSEEERREILSVANSPEFRDKSPRQIVPLLADQGRYLASESSFYRILRQEGQMTHRGPAKAPVAHPRPEHRATGPNQVWSWDITFLRTLVAGQFYYLYLFVDVWSRKIVGFELYERESTDLAAELFEDILKREKVSGLDLVLHSDNGSPMKGATLRATLERLGVIPSYSRPQVSDDNPYSEALFRTLKYRPEYPRKPFASLEEAWNWVAGFVRWYNCEHLHSAIGFVTPLHRHEGQSEVILEARKALYDEARRKHPHRWNGRPPRKWDAPDEVFLNPSKLTPTSLTRPSVVI